MRKEIIKEVDRNLYTYVKGYEDKVKSQMIAQLVEQGVKESNIKFDMTDAETCCGANIRLIAYGEEEITTTTKKSKSDK